MRLLGIRMRWRRGLDRYVWWRFEGRSECVARLRRMGGGLELGGLLCSGCRMCPGQVSIVSEQCPVWKGGMSIASLEWYSRQARILRLESVLGLYIQSVDQVRKFPRTWLLLWDRLPSCLMLVRYQVRRAEGSIGVAVLRRARSISDRQNMNVGRCDPDGRRCDGRNECVAIS